MPKNIDQLIPELIPKVLENNSEAIKQFARIVGNMTNKILYRKYKHIDRDVLGDIVHKVILNIDRFDQSTRLQPGIYTIANNHVITIHERKKDTTELYEECASVTPHEEFEQNDFNKYLRDIINELPEKQRKIVEMRYFEDKQFKEIGKQLGISAPVAYKNLKRALQKLKLKIKR